MKSSLRCSRDRLSYYHSSCRLPSYGEEPEVPKGLLKKEKGQGETGLLGFSTCAKLCNATFLKEAWVWFELGVPCVVEAFNSSHKEPEQALTEQYMCPQLVHQGKALIILLGLGHGCWVCFLCPLCSMSPLCLSLSACRKATKLLRGQAGKKFSRKLPEPSAISILAADLSAGCGVVQGHDRAAPHGICVQSKQLVFWVLNT